MKYLKRHRFKIVRSLDEIPTFASEDEEREWWGTHELSPSLYDKLETTPSPNGASLDYILRERAKAKTNPR